MLFLLSIAKADCLICTCTVNVFSVNIMVFFMLIKNLRSVHFGKACWLKLNIVTVIVIHDNFSKLKSHLPNCDKNESRHNIPK